MYFHFNLVAFINYFWKLFRHDLMLNSFWGASQWHNIKYIYIYLKSLMWFENNLDRVFESWSISFIVLGPFQMWSSQVYNFAKNLIVENIFFYGKANIMADAKFSIHFVTWCESANQKINIMNRHWLIEMVLILLVQVWSLRAYFFIGSSVMAWKGIDWLKKSNF